MERNGTKVGVFVACLLHAVAARYWSTLFILSSCLSILLAATFLFGCIARLLRRGDEGLNPQQSVVAANIRPVAVLVSDTAYFGYYAVSLVDLEYSALVFLASLVLGTFSCWISGAWMAVLASAAVLLSDHVYRFQQRRIDVAVSTGREFLFWCVALIKPPE